MTTYQVKQYLMLKMFTFVNIHIHFTYSSTIYPKILWNELNCLWRDVFTIYLQAWFWNLKMLSRIIWYFNRVLESIYDLSKLKNKMIILWFTKLYLVSIIPKHVFDNFIFKNDIKGESFTNQTKKMMFWIFWTLWRPFFKLGDAFTISQSCAISFYLTQAYKNHEYLCAHIFVCELSTRLHVFVLKVK